ncbi:MAG: serine protease [Pseudomonadota bacterium]
MHAFFTFIIISIVLFSNFSCANNLASLIKTIKPSIVGVGTYMGVRRPPSKLSGTGFIVADGRYVITNFHVLPKILNKEKREKLVVFYRNKNKILYKSVKIIDTDPKHDLALLKLVNAKLPPLAINQNSKPEEGEPIVFTGFPIGAVLGLYPVTHQGIISAISPIGIPVPSSAHLNSKIIRHLQQPYMIFQLDATAYPGNSGSPVISKISKQVIGVINKVFIKESKESVLQKPSGITYAIPAEHIISLLKKNKLMP